MGSEIIAWFYLSFHKTVDFTSSKSSYSVASDGIFLIATKALQFVAYDVHIKLKTALQCAVCIQHTSSWWNLICTSSHFKYEAHCRASIFNLQYRIIHSFISIWELISLNILFILLNTGTCWIPWRFSMKRVSESGVGAMAVTSPQWF